MRRFISVLAVMAMMAAVMAMMAAVMAVMAMPAFATHGGEQRVEDIFHPTATSFLLANANSEGSTRTANQIVQENFNP